MGNNDGSRWPRLPSEFLAALTYNYIAKEFSQDYWGGHLATWTPSCNIHTSSFTTTLWKKERKKKNYINKNSRSRKEVEIWIKMREIRFKVVREDKQQPKLYLWEGSFKFGSWFLTLAKLPHSWGCPSMWTIQSTSIIGAPIWN